VQQTVWLLLNDFARVPVCGLIAQYNSSTPVAGPDMMSVLHKRLTLRGFIVLDFAGRQADFLREAGEWVRSGRLKYREDIVKGLEHAPTAFLGLLEGRIRQDAGEGGVTITVGRIIWLSSKVVVCAAPCITVQTPSRRLSQCAIAATVKKTLAARLLS
jgi:hypothetical protein